MKVTISKNEFIEYAESIGLKILQINENTVEMEIEPAPIKAPVSKAIDPKFQQLAGIDIKTEQAHALDSFNLRLLNTGERKIGVIKVIRSITGLDLYEAKNFVDNWPQIIARGLHLHDAQRFARDLREAGADVDIV